jgi:hypothetical protein
MISTVTAPLVGRELGETQIMYDVFRKAKSVILYGSSITLGLVLCKAWFIAQAIA